MNKNLVKISNEFTTKKKKAKLKAGCNNYTVEINGNRMAETWWTGGGRIMTGSGRSQLF